MLHAGRFSLAVINVSLVLGMVSMSGLVLANVILRYGFQSGLPFSVEISRLIFVWIVFVGAVAAMAEGSHLSVNMLVRFLPRRAAAWLAVASHAVMLCCCYLIGKGSYALALINWNNKSPISGVSIAFLYGAGVVFAVGCGVVLLTGIWRIFSGWQPYAAVQEPLEADR
ncbi:TRAP transporter small permease [Halovulum sp. GXIMD14794]